MTRLHRSANYLKFILYVKLIDKLAGVQSRWISIKWTEYENWKFQNIEPSKLKHFLNDGLDSWWPSGIDLTLDDIMQNPLFESWNALQISTYENFSSYEIVFKKNQIKGFIFSVKGYLTNIFFTAFFWYKYYRESHFSCKCFCKSLSLSWPYKWQFSVNYKHFQATGNCKNNCK